MVNQSKEVTITSSPLINTLVNSNLKSTELMPLVKTLANKNEESKTSLEAILSKSTLNQQQPAAIASSSTLLDVDIPVQLSYQSLPEFFKQSTDDLTYFISELKKHFKGFSYAHKEETKNALKHLNTIISDLKHNSRLEFHGRKIIPDPNTNIKLIHFNSYLNSLKRIRKTAEKITKYRLCFIKFFTKFGLLIISKEPDAHEDCDEFMSDLRKTISKMSRSMMFTELTNQSDCLRELRHCYYKIGDQSEVERPAKKNLFSSQGIILRCIKDFLLQGDANAERLQSMIRNSADKFDECCLTNEDKFHDMLEDIKDKYPSSLQSVWNETSGFDNPAFSLPPSDELRFVKTRKSHDKKGVTFFDLNGNPLSDSHCSGEHSDDSPVREKYTNEKAINTSAQLLLETKIAQTKGLSSMFDYWENQLSLLFKSNVSHKTQKLRKVNRMTTSFEEQLNKDMKKYNKQCHEEFKSENKIILSTLRQSVKAVSSASASLLQIPSALDLLRLENPQGHSKMSDQKTTFEHFVSKIKKQNLQVWQIVSDKTTEFIKMVTVTLKEFRNLLLFNQRYINPWTLRKHKMEIAELILAICYKKVNIALNDSQGVLDTLAGKLKIHDEELGLKIYESQRRVNNVFRKHMRNLSTCLQSLDRFLKICCEHIQSFFLDKFVLSSSVLSQIRKSLADYCLAQKHLGVIVEKKDNDAGENNDQLGFNSFASTNENTTVNNNPNHENDRRIFKPTSLPKFPDWVVKIPQNKCKNDMESGEKVARTLLQDSEATTESWQLRRSGEFIRNYIQKAEKEDKIPKWAKDTYISDDVQ